MYGKLYKLITEAMNIAIISTVSNGIMNENKGRVQICHKSCSLSMVIVSSMLHRSGISVAHVYLNEFFMSATMITVCIFSSWLFLDV